LKEGKGGKISQVGKEHGYLEEDLSLFFWGDEKKALLRRKRYGRVLFERGKREM